MNHNKQINFNFQGQKLVFDTSLRLFSHNRVDEGSKELLNSLRKNKKINYSRILDLGCGYGVLGIFLKKSNPSSDVLCSDRDSLALEFTENNSKLNNVELKTLASIDFENIEEKFSLIVSNFPAKLEADGLKKFIFKSSNYLENEGIFCGVIVKELETDFQKLISETNFEKEIIKVVFSEKNKNYFVFHLSFNEKLDFEYDYISNELNFKIENKSAKITTAVSVPEFDRPHIISELIYELLPNKKIASATIINPNSGFVPLFLSYTQRPEKLNLVSVDLLSLKFSQINLEENNFSGQISLEHSDKSNEKGDLLIWSLLDEDLEFISKKVLDYKENFNKIIIGGRKNILYRLQKKLKIRFSKEKSEGKYSAIEL